jgi:hypothetical protein
MDQTDGPETSANINQTLGIHPKVETLNTLTEHNGMDMLKVNKRSANTTVFCRKHNTCFGSLDPSSERSENKKSNMANSAQNEQGPIFRDAIKIEIINA